MCRGFLVLLVLSCTGCLGGCEEGAVCEPGSQRPCWCDEINGNAQQTCLADGSGWGGCDCPCKPDCTGLECGPDPVCGLSCGVCGPYQRCSDEHTCVPADHDCGELDPDCSGPGLADQGPDRDRDGWGDCCDCDDADHDVHPGRSELIYNCKDDDCDPATSDGDRDGDGHVAAARACDPGPDCDDRDPGVHPGRFELSYNCKDDDCDPATFDGDLDGDGHVAAARVCDPGPDCDDRDPRTHPDAAELCDGVDNDCDGYTDEDACNLPDGGIPDGGDEPAPACPDISGRYRVHTPMADPECEITIVQEDCEVSFNPWGLGCTGTLNAGMHLHFSCSGIPAACSGEVSLTTSFTIACSEDFVWYFVPLDDPIPCTRHDQPECVQNGELCGVKGNEGNPETVCVATLPGGASPGTFCDPASGIRCVNSLCIDSACGAVCESQADCDPFPGTACRKVHYDDGHDTVGEISACVPPQPGQTRCGRSTECAPFRVCGILAANDSVTTACIVPGPEDDARGKACSQSMPCASGLCLCGDQVCRAGEEGTCSEPCRTDADCLHNHICGAATVHDLHGGEHPIDACIRIPDACATDADCPPGQCCQMFTSDDGQTIATRCHWAGGAGEPDTGSDCVTHSECFSVFCHDYPGYCLGLCIDDSDCPRWFANACVTDGDCQHGYLCNEQSGLCRREFRCTTLPFTIGHDVFGNPVVDTVDACTPVRRDCQANEDCRTEEACKLFYDRDATHAVYQCDPGGPGTAASGESCYPDEEGCWTGMCLHYDGGGEGMQFCSRPCLQNTDCGDPAVFYCASLQVNVRPGFVSYVPVCALRDP